MIFRDLFGTLKNVFRMGDGSNSHKTFEINNGDEHLPKWRYNYETNKFEFSNNGVAWLDPATSATNIASVIYGVDAKTTPVDADEIAGIDTENENVLKKHTWTNIKAFLKTYFDTLYDALGTTGRFSLGVAEATADITADTIVTIQVDVPSGTKILGIQMRVDVALADGETWIAAYSGGATQNIATDKAIAQNTKVNKFFDENEATAITSGETDIAITKTGGGAFTAQGNIRAIVYYQKFTTVSDA